MQSVLLTAIVWQPIASPLKIVSGGVVLAALAVFAYLRVFPEHRRAAAALLLMRLGVIAAVCTLLFGPSREIPQSPSSQRPRLSILVDTSESMLTGDCAGSTRIDYVARHILGPAQLQALSEQFELDVQGFDETLHPLSLTRLHHSPRELATGRSTRLAASVTAAVSRIRSLDEGHILLVVSDGRDTEDAPVPPAASLAAGKGIPIFTVGVGGAQSAVDAALLAVPQQDALLPGEPGGILVKVYQSGLDDQPSYLRVVSGPETQRIPVRLRRGQATEAQITIRRDEPGQYEFEVSLEPLPGETELANNAQTVFVEVMKRRIRVLLLEGNPFWDSKFLAQSLRKDEQIELTQITQVAATKQERIITRATAAAGVVPQTPEEWGEYDVVVLGRNVERLLSARAAEALASCVASSGGNVVFARGPAWDPAAPQGARLSELLSVLEPVVWGDASVEGLALMLTPSGRTAAWFAPTKMGTDPEAALRQLPGFEQMREVVREKSGALTLVRALPVGTPQASGWPAITRMTYGRGQVVAILGEGLWRWSLLPPERHDLRGFYDTFWSNLVRWLALGGDFPPGQQVSLQLSRTSVRLGDELLLDIAYKQPPPGGADPHLEVAGPDGRRMNLPLHPLPGPAPRFRANFRPEQTGVHQVLVRTPGSTPPSLSRKINVYEVNLERLQTSANFLTLQMLAEHSGGAAFDAAAAADLRQSLRRHREATLVPPQLESVWDHGVLMTLLLLWAGGEWLFRRAVGLW